MPKQPATGDAEDTNEPASIPPTRTAIPASMAGAAKAALPAQNGSVHPSELIAGIAPTSGDTRSALIGAIATLDLFQLRVVAQLLVGLRTRFPDGLPKWGDNQRAEIVEAMLATVPDSGVYERQIGMFFTTTGVGRMTHLSNPTVLRYVRNGRLLAIDTSEGYLFPEFQFSARGEVADPLPEVLSILRAAGMDNWRIARWMTTSRSGRPRPIDLLNSGDGAGAVRRARSMAKHFAKNGGL